MHIIVSLIPGMNCNDKVSSSIPATLVQLDGSIIVLKATISCYKIKAILAD